MQRQPDSAQAVVKCVAHTAVFMGGKKKKKQKPTHLWRSKGRLWRLDGQEAGQKTAATVQ